jgi:ribosomal protein L31
MFLTVVAVLCHLNVGHRTIAPDTDCTSEESRVEECVTDSSMDNSLDFFSCMLHAQIAVANWKENHPMYRDSDWRVARIACVQGQYKPNETI